MRQQYQWLSEVAEFGSVPPSLLSLGGIWAVSYTTRSLSLPSSPASFPSWLVLGSKDDLQYHPASLLPLGFSKRWSSCSVFICACWWFGLFVHAVDVAGGRAIFRHREWVGAVGAGTFWLFDLPRSAGGVLSGRVVQECTQEFPPMSHSALPCRSSPAAGLAARVSALCT